MIGHLRLFLRFFNQSENNDQLLILGSISGGCIRQLGHIALHHSGEMINDDLTAKCKMDRVPPNFQCHSGLFDCQINHTFYWNSLFNLEFFPLLQVVQDT